MSPRDGEDATRAASLARDLASAQAKVTTARAQLASLLQDVAQAEARLNSNQAAQLLEANEQLVFAALRNQEVAESATQALAEVTQSAELDPLTGLPNRVRLLDRFAQGVAMSKRHGNQLAVLFLDLDNFKQINDRLGHAAGDTVLKMVARRLGAAVRDADTVSRHGGDEFLILLTEVSQRADAALLAGKLLTAIGLPAQVGRDTLHLSASIGISVYPQDGEDAKSLIDLADAAMYQAKRQGPGRCACHGDAVLPMRADPMAPLDAASITATATGQTLAEVQRRHAELCVANERLLLSALQALEGQASLEQAYRKLLAARPGLDAG